MSILKAIRPRREKLFGDGRPRALDRNAKARIMHIGRELMRRTESGKAYGAITAKAYAVLGALLYGFHNARSGLCFPSYDSIAEKAGCARSTVADAIKALELAGLLTWVNRLARIKVWSADLGQTVVRVIRTSNGYRFMEQKGGVPPGLPTESEKPPGTTNQDSLPPCTPHAPPGIDPATPLGAAFLRLTALRQARSARA